MNSRWATFVAASLVTFTSLVITWQFRHYNDVRGTVNEGKPYLLLAQSFLRGKRLAGITNIVDRSQEFNPTLGFCRYYDLVLPANARVFMTAMIGSSNSYKMPYYTYITYHLFPREIGVSVDQPTHIIYSGNRFLGRTSESDLEILTNGFDVRLDILPENRLHVKILKELPARFPANPSWFNSRTDAAIAFLLPLLTALAGMWLLRLLFSALSRQMPLLEQLACGLGLGMMTVAALTLGVKLCGFHGRGLVFILTGVGAVAEIWRDRKSLFTKITDGGRKLVRCPLATVFVIVGLFVFLILFRIAGLEGLVDLDAERAWSLKAKIMHLSAGNDLVHWFSAPRLADAHLDYPTLVPSLHAATYDSLGHVDEFVTKFWPTWMLFFLLATLASLTRPGNSWRYISLFTLLGLLLLPVTQRYVQTEGSTMPMIFFTTMGFVQCAFWLIEKDRARLGLGLTFLFGGAMAHFEGFIFLALAGSWLLLSARPSLRLTPPFWRVLAFWAFGALPFICLRLQIPALHYQSAWTSYAAHHLGVMLVHWPAIFLILLARRFLKADFADWNADDGHFHWIGKWDGLSSLYNQFTLGLPWLCLLLVFALWLAAPARRRVIIWVLAMFIGAMAALSGVISSFIGVDGVNNSIELTDDSTGGRYALPVLLACFATVITLFFVELLSSEPNSDTSSITDYPASPRTPDPDRPVLKGGYWLAIGAFLIWVSGVFVLPKQTALPEHLTPIATAVNPRGSSEGDSPENTDLQRRMDLADRMYRDGKFAEAVQEFREAVRLYPNNPGALNNLAWCLATNPKQELRNSKEAVQLATRAVELTGQQQPVFIGTLAIAYAEDGQPARALEMAEKARKIALLTSQAELAATIDQLLKQYSLGKAIGLTNKP